MCRIWKCLQAWRGQSVTTCMLACLHTKYIHITYILTYIHKYIHTYIHKLLRQHLLVVGWHRLTMAAGWRAQLQINRTVQHFRTSAQIARATLYVPVRYVAQIARATQHTFSRTKWTSLNQRTHLSKGTICSTCPIKKQKTSATYYSKLYVAEASLQCDSRCWYGHLWKPASSTWMHINCMQQFCSVQNLGQSPMERAKLIRSKNKQLSSTACIICQARHDKSWHQFSRQAVNITCQAHAMTVGYQVAASCSSSM